MRFLAFPRVLALLVCIGAATLAGSRCRAQSRPDSTMRRDTTAQRAGPDAAPEEEAGETAAETRRCWGVGVQVAPVFGLSLRYAITERFSVQAAGIPVPVGDDRAVGARGLFKLYAQPAYNFYLSAGANAFWGGEVRNPFTEEEGRDTTYTLFSTLGGEYRFAERLGLGGGIGIGYFVQRSPFIDRNEVVPTLDVGLHYYF